MFRIFDALNDVEQMRPAIEAVRATGTTVAEVALCYTGDLSDPGEELYTLDYYLAAGRADRRRRRPRAGDQGHGRAAARARPPAPWSPRCASASTCRSTCTPTTPPAASSRRWSPRSSRASTRSTPRARRWPAPPRSRRCPRWWPRPTTPTARPGCRWTALCELEPYWEAIRRVYAPFESGLPSPTGRVYTHEIPGGQLSNLRQQAIALGLGEKFEQIEDMYAAANDILGNIVKVTPSSKVVGDLALHLVAVGADPAEFADEPGEVRHPRLGHRLPLRRARRPARRLAGAVPHQGARGPHLEAAPAELLDDDDARRPRGRADRRGAVRSTGCCSPARPRTSRSPARRTATSRCCRPATTSTACAPATSTSSTSRRARRVLFGLEAISEPDERGFRTVHGHHQRPAAPGHDPRPVRRRRGRRRREGRHRRSPARSPPPSRASSPSSSPRATPVDAGDTVATIEAMKMEASITAPVAGTVERLAISGTQPVDGGDLVLVVG